MSFKEYSSKEYVNEAIAAIPQPDWNQNDPTKPDYVKNRTHYEELGESLVTFPGSAEWVEWVDCPNVGETIGVSINGGEMQIYTVKEGNSEGTSCLYIGNCTPTEYWDAELVNDKWWFWVVPGEGLEIYTGVVAADYEFTVRKASRKTIPERFLPETIPEKYIGDMKMPLTFSTDIVASSAVIYLDDLDQVNHVLSRKMNVYVTGKLTDSGFLFKECIPCDTLYKPIQSASGMVYVTFLSFKSPVDKESYFHADVDPDLSTDECPVVSADARPRISLPFGIAEIYEVYASYF